MRITQRIRTVIVAGLLCLFAGMSSIAQSSEWKAGFELGWANSKIQGDLEMDDSGGDFETQKFNSGFHLSFYARRYFTDLFGIQFGLTYAQRGGRIELDGDSYHVFGLQSAQRRFTQINRVQSLKILNGYLDIPVVAFHRIGERFEVGAGAYVAYMVVSKADGELRISERASGGSSVETFFINNDYNYFKNEFGEETFGVQTIAVDGATFDEPRTVGAYYEYLTDPGEKFFNRFDVGLIAQVGYYLNNSLNLKGRFMYSISDVTKEETDVSRASVTQDQQFILRDDTDRNLSMQISLGFLF